MKKLPVVKCRQGTTKTTRKYNYSFSEFNMAWVSNPKIGRQQATAIIRCREFLCSCVCANVYKNDFNSYFIADKDVPIDMDKTRLLILNNGTVGLSRQQFKKSLFKGKKLLNIYEEIGNFSGLSKISTIEHEIYGKQWLITGPKEWMKSGQLISAMTFLLRLSIYGNSINITSLTTIETSFCKMIKSKLKQVKYESDVSLNLSCFWDKMWVLIKFQDKLFSTDYKKNYISSLDNNDFGMRCGIRNLAAGTSGLAEGIDKKFAELCKEHLPRKQ